MSDKRTQEIRDTLGLPDSVVFDSKMLCLQAKDARYLLGRIERYERALEEIAGITARERHAEEAAPEMQRIARQALEANDAD